MFAYNGCVSVYSMSKIKTTKFNTKNRNNNILRNGKYHILSNKIKKNPKYKSINLHCNL